MSRKIRENDIIKHHKFMDVAFFVMSSRELENEIKMKGLWINQGYVETFVLNKKLEDLTVERSDLNNWSICCEPTMKCVRDAKWRQIK